MVEPGPRDEVSKFTRARIMLKREGPPELLTELSAVITPEVEQSTQSGVV